MVKVTGGNIRNFEREEYPLKHTSQNRSTENGMKID
jgi:hypothetical protein